MVYGWAGTILRIDLSKSKVSKTPSSEYTRLFVGGRGVNAKLMFEESKAGVSSLDPENPIIIGAGALVGTGVLGAVRLEITTKSPEQTPEGFGNVGIGGSFAKELKFAGYDNIVVRGKAEKPTYICIENEEVELRDATGVWGRGVFETNSIMREDLGDPEVRIVAIGQAGERLVRLATIEHEYRSGTALGAVFGAKNLKAVVVRGTNGIKVHDPEAILAMNSKRIEEIKKSQEESIRLKREQRESYETPSIVGADALSYWFEKTEMGIIGYFDGFEWSDLEKTRGAPYIKERMMARTGCCPISCIGIMRVPGCGTGVMRCYPFFWPWALRLTDMDKVFEANMLCSDYGIESRNLALTVSWLMKLYEEGIITAKDTDGIPMEWGSSDALIQTIHKLAKREGFGDVLADGVIGLAKKLGPKAESRLIHSRGVVPGTDELRCMTGTALGEAVDTSKSTENTLAGTLWERYMKKMGLEKEIEEAYVRAEKTYGTKKAIIPWEYEGKPQMMMQQEHLEFLNDVLGICLLTLGFEERLFGAPGMPIPSVLPLHTLYFNAATGLNVNNEWLQAVAERSLNTERAYNVREGFTRNHDTISEKYFKEPVPNGPRKGMKLDKAKFEKMKDKYYKLRGWNVETGIPTRETYEKLGLKDIADELERLGRIPKPKKA